jgi:phosphatidylserine/phosphatidylglycerophosphate/cardiolipin synthase-like enzyme
VVEAIIRLRRPHAEPPGVRVVARFGRVATCRLRLAAVPGVWAHPDVVSLKAARPLSPEDAASGADEVTEPARTAGRSHPCEHHVEERPARSVPDALAGHRRAHPIGRDIPRRPAGLPLTGAGVVVGAVDWGLDIDHPNFKHPDGSTRLVALWDQRSPERRQPEAAPAGTGPAGTAPDSLGPDSLGPDSLGPAGTGLDRTVPDRTVPDSAELDGTAAEPPEPYGYGTVHSRQQIDRALQTDHPFRTLGYHPADADRGTGAHGTHVMDIAAGNGSTGPAGMAPGADLVFVHLADRGTGGLANLGDSVRLLEAVDFIARTAGERPWVVNLSMGRHGGPHDGTTLVELALDELLSAAPGRFLAQSAGNYHRARTHATGTVGPGQRAVLRFVTDPADTTPNELEIWYAGGDEIAVSIDPPGTSGAPPVLLGDTADVVVAGQVVGRVYHRAHDPNNGDHHIDAFLSPSAPAGEWRVTIEGRRVGNGRFHAWLERDEACRRCQARFVPADASPDHTTGTIANGHLPLVVGSYDDHSPRRPAGRTSSRGPTRDDRGKPDLAAPGVGVLAARSAPRGSERSPGLLVRKTGTSMAAPHVTGAVALCLEYAGHRLGAAEIRRLVLSTTDPPARDPACDPARGPAWGGPLGRGYLNLPALLAAVRRNYPPEPEVAAMERDDITPLALAPARAYRELLYRPAGELAAWFGGRFTILARPGQPVRDQLGVGDVVLRAVLGRPGARGDCLVVAEPGLTRRRSSRPDEPAGWYAVTSAPGSTAVSAAGARPVRVLDPAGLVPPGQLLLRTRPIEPDREPPETVQDCGCGRSLTGSPADDSEAGWDAGREDDGGVGLYSGLGVTHGSGQAATTLDRTPSQVGREIDEAPLAGVVPGPADYWRQQLRYGLVGNTVEPLVDGPATFRAIQRAIESATDGTHYIYLLAWWLDPWVNLDGPGTSLLDLFARAGERGVQVRVLAWDAPRLTLGPHSALHDAAVAAISRLPNCHAQQDLGGGLTSAKSHHQKLLVVQGRDGLVALCGGVDVNADRIHDLPPPPGSYRADRPAVGWTGASGGSGGSGPQGTGNPLHDVHARVTGPTALPLLRMFLRRWWARSGDRAIDRQAPLRGRYDQAVPAPTGRQFARAGETFNGVLRLPSGNVRSREVTVQDIWLRSILGARQFIYMEEQYLLSDCAAAAIRAMLPKLAHVTILIAPSEITDMPGVWQRRRAFIDAITQGNPHANRLHIYTRTVGQQQPCVRANAPHLYIHAKTAVIDDELMLIGSANCNNRGWETDSELVVASFEDARGPASVAGRLRAELWAHHLGVAPSAVADPVASRALWDTAASRQVCRYDPLGGRDRSNRPDSLVDPSDRRPGDPCRTLLPAATGPGPAALTQPDPAKSGAGKPDTEESDGKEQPDEEAYGEREAVEETVALNGSADVDGSGAVDAASLDGSADVGGSGTVDAASLDGSADVGGSGTVDAASLDGSADIEGPAALDAAAAAAAAEAALDPDLSATLGLERAASADSESRADSADATDEAIFETSGGW